MNMSLQPQESMTVGQRIVGVLYSGPREAFADIANKPGWLPPVLIISAVSLLCSVAIIPKMQEFLMYTLELQAQTSPELADPAVQAMAANTAVVAAVAGGLLGPFLMCLIFAGLLKLINLFVGEPVAYPQFLAVAAYAYFPALIGSVLATILIISSPATHLDQVTTSLYLLLPPGSQGFAANLARQIDPFYLWSLGLMALGASVSSRSRFSSYALVVGIFWLIFAVGSAFLAKGV